MVSVNSKRSNGFVQTLNGVNAGIEKTKRFVSFQNIRITFVKAMPMPLY